MILSGILFEDFVNYKKTSMTLMFPYCSFKCGKNVCQNESLSNTLKFQVNEEDIISRYLDNPITKAIVMQGLEPFDSWEDLWNFIGKFREKSDDDIVIYTGYNKAEIEHKIECLALAYNNIVVKFGRFIPGMNPHFDEVLGVNLASNNQYTERIC